MGGVIYIGDREAGKTHLAWELTNPKKEFVEVSNLNYDFVKSLVWDSDKGKMRATSSGKAIYRESMEVQVQLASSKKTISSFWLDTPGEIWRSTWQAKNPDLWKNFLNSIRETEGILLILPPYREIIDPAQDDPNNHISRQQWMQRLDRWVDFFKQDCSQIRHLLLCLNKIDLCMDEDQLTKEAKLLKYNPIKQSKNWNQKHEYVYYRYFAPFHEQIQELNRGIDGLSVRCFITTIHSRELLELPWIYLGCHLAKTTSY